MILERKEYDEIIEELLDEHDEYYPPFHNNLESSAFIKREIEYAEQSIEELNKEFKELWKFASEDIDVSDNIEKIITLSEELISSSMNLLAVAEKSKESLELYTQSNRIENDDFVGNFPKPKKVLKKIINMADRLTD